jgi:nucleotide-binding universal stress UspA family protein
LLEVTMSYKTVCVGLVAGDPRNDATISVAATLAAAHDAHLSGLCVVPLTTMDVYAAPRNDPGDSYRAKNEAAAKTSAAAFAERCKGADITTNDWQTVNGSVLACLDNAATYADVVVLSQHVGGKHGWLVGDAALALGVPILAVPKFGTHESFGKRILIAWTPRRECRRAVHDAMPMLQAADSVLVLRVNPDDDHREADIGAYLTRHGVPNEVKDLTTSEVSVGDAILNAVTDEACDLIAMGAYGHSRAREFTFGGVTRHVLEHMTAPTLLSH